MNNTKTVQPKLHELRYTFQHDSNNNSNYSKLQQQRTAVFYIRALLQRWPELLLASPNNQLTTQRLSVAVQYSAAQEVAEALGLSVAADPRAAP